MNFFPVLGSMAAGLLYVIAGMRIYSLSRQSGSPSDRLIALSLLLWGVSYFAYDIPYWIVGDEGRVPPIFEVAWRVADYGADIAFALFIRSVFRRGKRWAAWLVGGIALCLVVGAGGMTWTSQWDGADLLSSPWYWLETVGILTASVWMTTEGFGQYLKARQRKALGLCTPLVCNRYLLWGIVGALWGMSELIGIPQQAEFEIIAGWSISVDAVVTSLDIPAVVVMWFVFFPPAFYRKWIDSPAAVPDSAVQEPPHGV